MRDEIGAVAAFKDVEVVPACPKTRSGKILRKTMREIADGEDAGGALARSRTPTCWSGSGRSCAARAEDPGDRAQRTPQE